MGHLSHRMSAPRGRHSEDGKGSCVYVSLSKGALHPYVAEGDDLTTLSVRTVAAGRSRLMPDVTLAAAQVVTDQRHAWLDVAQLRLLAGTRSDEWHRRFGEMIAFAASRGWMSADGTRVRAHIEPEAER